MRWRAQPNSEYEFTVRKVRALTTRLRLFQHSDGLNLAQVDVRSQARFCLLGIFFNLLCMLIMHALSVAPSTAQRSLGLLLLPELLLADEVQNDAAAIIIQESLHA